MVLKWCEDNHWRNQHIIYVKSWEPEAEAWLVVSYKLKDTQRCIIWIRMVTGRPPHDHVRPAFHELHWLPIPLRIKFKVALLMFLVHTNQCPAYISETMTSVSCGPSQRRVPTPFLWWHELHYAKDKDQVWWESVLSCRTFHLELCPWTYLFCLQ